MTVPEHDLIWNGLYIQYELGEELKGDQATGEMWPVGFDVVGVADLDELFRYMETFFEPEIQYACEDHHKEQEDRAKERDL